MDNLKKHIQDKRNELEIEMPSELVWANIEKSLPANKKPKSTVIQLPLKWAVAASVIFLIALGWMVYEKMNSSLVNTPVAKQVINNTTPAPTTEKNNQLQDTIVKMPTEDIVATKRNSPIEKRNKTNHKHAMPTNQGQEDMASLASIENSFNQIIILQRARINTTPLKAESPAYFEDFSVEIVQMEKEENTIKREIKKHGLTNELLNQFINIFQQKINVLKKLQKEMQKTNNRYQQGRTPIEASKVYFLSI